MREVVFDVETTGVRYGTDRIVEIGAVELVGRLPTGRTFHCFVNPGMPMPKEAERVHGISDLMLADKPVFAEVIDGFLDFVGSDPLVAHNANFDTRMMKHELELLGREPLTNEVGDTIVLSKKMRPGKKHGLDAICRDFGIDLSRRGKHGALVDSQILAEVYLELTGGAQERLSVEVEQRQMDRRDDGEDRGYGDRPFLSRLTIDEFFDHADFVQTLATPIWADYTQAD